MRVIKEIRRHTFLVLLISVLACAATMLQACHSTKSSKEVQQTSVVKISSKVTRLEIGQVYTLLSGQNTNNYNKDDGDYFKLVDKMTWIEIQKNFSADGTDGEYPTLNAEVGKWTRKGDYYQFVGKSNSMTLSYSTRKNAKKGIYYQIEKSGSDYTQLPAVGLVYRKGQFYYGHYPIHTAHGNMPNTLDEIMEKNVLNKASVPK